MSALMAAVLIAGAWLVFGYNRQPRFEGQPVSYWFREGYRRDADEDTRHSTREITNALMHLGTKALPYLVGRALNTRPDSALRTNFYELLGKLPESWHLPKLIDSDDIRDFAVGSIWLIRPKADDILPLVRDAAISTNTLLHHQALLILSQVDDGEEWLAPLFARALHYEDAESRGMALDYLRGRDRLTNAVVPDLIELLKDTNSEELHGQAASLLGDIGPGAAAAVRLLKELFENETNWSRRATLAGSLWQIDSNQTAALGFLTNGLLQKGKPDEPDSPTVNYSGWPADLSRIPRSYAVLAADELSGIGTNARPAIPALFEALKSAEPFELPEITRALAAVGAPADAFLLILREKLKSDDDSMRLVAAEQILETEKDDHEVTSVLIGLIQKHSDAELPAITTLGIAGPAANSAIPTVLLAMDDTNWSIWTGAADALVELGAPPASFVPKLEARLASLDRDSPANQITTLQISGQILKADPANREAQMALIRLMRLGSKQLKPSEVVDLLASAKPPIEEVIPALKQAMEEAKKKRDLDYADEIEEAIDQIEANEKGK